MKNFLTALQFLTIAPVRLKNVSDGDLGRCVAYFPVVGLVLGLVLAGTAELLSRGGLEPLVSSIIITVILIILTGGMHLDGLSDASDALFSGKGRDEMLRIMRDPHVGAMGVLAIIAVLFLKIAFLSAISIETMPGALIVMCVLSRWSMAISVCSFPYARQEGKAKAFISGGSIKIFIAATLLTAVIVFLISKKAGVVLFAAAAAFAYLLNLAINKKIGGITGDTIGAVNEMSEVFVLFCVAVLERIYG
ncbi:MAG: adenosylcobinamide-GDP ribazoletransferase [Candidatus Omnitrophica bacterium]|nr:adenosylcobinamide-GDP ribazoletransferase [Candidatus Omnitrophota bacterium]